MKDPSTGLPAESYPRGYLARQLSFAPVLTELIDGGNVCCFSHAASVALVASLMLQPQHLSDGAYEGSHNAVPDLSTVGSFAPCGVYHLRAPGGGAPWELVRHGGTNEPYVAENHPSTYPWSHNAKNDELWRELVASASKSNIEG